MGFIYPWSAVRNGLVPSPDVYRTLAEATTDALHASPIVIAGSVFGSACRGDYTNRSDLDAFFVFPDELRADARRLRRRLREMAWRRHVVLNLRTHSLSEAGMVNEHCFGPSYAGTWDQLIEDGWMVGNPHDCYQVSSSPDVASEMERKMRRYSLRARLFRQRVEVALSRHGGFERLLERCHRANVRPAHTYVAIARMFLRWRDGSLCDESHSSVIRRAFYAVGFAPLRYIAAGIRELDQRYDDLLKETIEGRVSGAKYRQQTKEIFLAITEANVRLLEVARQHLVRSTVALSAA